jgi:hypothetical protein
VEPHSLAESGGDSGMLMLRLHKVRSMTELGKWFGSKGLSPGENSAFGVVNPVHVGHGSTWASYHYHTAVGMLGPDRLVGDTKTPQGNLAIDLNDISVADDVFHKFMRGHWQVWKPQSEAQALTLVYDRVLAAAHQHHWPLAELFFADRGYIASDPTHNHPQEGHDDHLHVAMSQHSW